MKKYQILIVFVPNIFKNTKYFLTGGVKGDAMDQCCPIGHLYGAIIAIYQLRLVAFKE
jgi:hypothetical protein